MKLKRLYHEHRVKEIGLERVDVIRQPFALGQGHAFEANDGVSELRDPDDGAAHDNGWGA